MSAPKRIHRKRTKGWRMPKGAVYVGRPTRWGNPFIVGDLLNGGNVGHSEAVELFRQAVIDGRLQNTVRQIRRDLAGRDLACYCPLDQPCHADVLLDLANGSAW